MDIIDNYFCPICARQLKQTIRKMVLYKVECVCGYRSKSTFVEIDRNRAIINYVNYQNSQGNKFRDLTKTT